MKVTASGRASKQKTSLRSFALTKKEKEETRLQCKKCRLEGRTGPETHKHRAPNCPYNVDVVYLWTSDVDEDEFEADPDQGEGGGGASRALQVGCRPPAY